MNIKYYLNTGNIELNRKVCNNLQSQLHNYYVSYDNDFAKIKLQRKHLSTTNYGDNMRNAMNPLKNIEIINDNKSIKILVNINPLIIILSLLFLFLIIFGYLLNYSIYATIFFIIVSYAIMTLNYFINIRRLIDIIKEVIFN